MLHQESKENGSCETWEVNTEAKCISQYFSRSPAGLLRLVTRWSNSLALDKSLYFFVIVIALTKAGTSEVVAADQTWKTQMVRAWSPAQARTGKVYPPWVWQHPPPQGTGIWRPVKHMLCFFIGKNWHKMREPWWRKWAKENNSDCSNSAEHHATFLYVFLRFLRKLSRNQLLIST